MKNQRSFKTRDGAETVHRRGSFVYRYYIIAGIFAALCVLYAVLIVTGTAGESETPDGPEEEVFTEAMVKIQAVRGEIYDRNGKLLVKNNYSYRLYFDYAAMSRTYSEQNDDIIRFYDMADEMSLRSLMPDPFCPLIGSWPEYTYDTAMLSGQVASSRQARILRELGLGEDAGASELASALAKKYRMTDKKGNALYTVSEMNDMLRFRYETEAIQFAPGEPYTVLDGIGIEVITRAKELNIPGLRILTSYSREYCYPGAASQILGRIGKVPAENVDYYTSKGYPVNAAVGVDGVEQAFEKILRGMEGEMKIVKDKDGNVVSAETVKEPEPGMDVYLTIDIDLQMTAERALGENIAYVNDRAARISGSLDGEDCDCGALVAQKTNTGEVLVLASWPTFDLSRFNETYSELIEDPRRPMFNRALEGTYAPGSTFKVGVACMALLEKITVNDGETFVPSTLIKTTGKYTYYEDYQPVCWIYTLRKASHGSINVTKALQVSCNCFFYELGRILGIETINLYCRNYGLGESTGIELHEVEGVLADSEYTRRLGVAWTGGLTIQTAIGQAYNRFTPAQLSSYLSTIVNGGSRWALHVLKEVRSFDGTVVESYVPNVLSSVAIDAGTVGVLRNAMSKVVDESTTVTAFDKFPIKVGGKTGTAQVTGQSSNAVFLCFAPLDDPDITVAVVLERGATGANAARSARTVMDAYFLGQY